MICPHCKEENKEGFEYCSSCGKWMPDRPEGEEFSIEEVPEVKDSKKAFTNEEVRYKKVRVRPNRGKIIQYVFIFFFYIGLTCDSFIWQTVIINIGFVLIMTFLATQNKDWTVKEKIKWLALNIAAKTVISFMFFRSPLNESDTMIVHIVTSLPGLLWGYYADEDNYREISVREDSIKPVTFWNLF